MGGGLWGHSASVWGVLPHPLLPSLWSWCLGRGQQKREGDPLVEQQSLSEASGTSLRNSPGAVLGSWHWLLEGISVCKGSPVGRLADWSPGYVSCFVCGGRRAGPAAAHTSSSLGPSGER